MMSEFSVLIPKEQTGTMLLSRTDCLAPQDQLYNAAHICVRAVPFNTGSMQEFLTAMIRPETPGTKTPGTLPPLEQL